MKQQAATFSATHLVSGSANGRILVVALLDTPTPSHRTQVPHAFAATTILSTGMIYTLPTASHAKGTILTQIESPLGQVKSLVALGEALN